MADNALLDRVLTAADPARTPRDATPDVIAMATRDRIIRSSVTPRPRRRLALKWASGLAVATAAVVVAVAVMTPQGAALAGTPSPLDFEGASTVASTIDDARHELADGVGPSEPERSVSAVSWVFSTDDGKIVPQFSVLTWEPDLSGRMLIFDGVPYDPTEARADQAEVVNSGVLSLDLVMKPGEFGTPYTEVPGESKADIVGMLHAFGMPDDPTGYEVVSAVISALDQWTLTDAQQAELLSVLDGVDGVGALGTSTDRLGRTVAGLRVVATNGAASETLLISTDTGRIVGTERTSLIDEGVVPTGAIIGYRMWDVEQGALG